MPRPGHELVVPQLQRSRFHECIGKHCIAPQIVAAGLASALLTVLGCLTPAYVGEAQLMYAAFR